MLNDGDTLQMNDPRTLDAFENFGQKSFYGREFKIITFFSKLTRIKLCDRSLTRICRRTNKEIERFNKFLTSINKKKYRAQVKGSGFG